MKSTFKLRLLLLLLAILLPLMGADAKTKKALLWKIEGKDIKTSYLYGTVHVLPQKDFKITDKVKSLVKTSDHVVLEMDMDSPTLQADIMRHVKMKDNNSIDKLISKEEFQLLDSITKKTNGVSIESFKTWQPIMLTSFFLKLVAGDQPASYEMAFIMLARGNKKEIVGLETAEEVLGVMHKVPYKEQAKKLIEFLEDIDEGKKLFKKLIDAYKEKDIDALYKLILEDSGDEKFGKMLIDERNKNWIDDIQRVSRDKSAFIAVGAGHLAGKNGLIKLLRKKGYKVTALE